MAKKKKAAKVSAKAAPARSKKTPRKPAKAQSPAAKKGVATSLKKTSTKSRKAPPKTSAPANLLAPMSPNRKSSAKEAVPVKAEIVENQISRRAPSELKPLGDSLSQYLANVNKYPLLTREQEAIIAERYFKDRNPNDAEILVTSNLRFVVKVAAEYSKFGNKLIDLIQEGNIGLMHAVKEFNPYKGVRLITYAVWWIRGYIQEYLMRHHSIVRIGTTQNQRKLFYHLQREKNQLDQLGQESSVKLLSSKLGIPEDDVRMMEERMSGRDISLDAPVSEDGPTHRLDLEASHDEAVDEQLARSEDLSILNEKISKLRETLNPKEIYLLDQRLLADQPITLQEIGEKWGVTREAVRQMESRLMKKIKDEMQST